MVNNTQEQKKELMKGLLQQDKKEKKLFEVPVVEESQAKELPKVEERQKQKDLKQDIKKELIKKTYNIPVELFEDMKKVVYMDRDIKDNTDLLVKALTKYLNSKEVKGLIEEYNNIKG